MIDPAVISAIAVLRGYQPCRFGQIHYRYAQPTAGGGKTPLLCLHASPRSSLAYSDFLPLMGVDRLAFAADTPGYGLSDPPPTQPTINDYAAAMGDMIDAMGLKQVDVIGTHTASATALELARQRPRQVRKIVISSALMYTSQERADNAIKLAARDITQLEPAIAGLLVRWAEHRKIWFQLGEELAWQTFWETNRNITRQGWGYRAAGSYDFERTLEAITQPLLILNPRDDLWEITARANGKVRNGRVMDMPQKLSIFSAHPAEASVAVREFLDDEQL